MPDTALFAEPLIRELREKIKDTSWSLVQASIVVSGATTALLEVLEDSLETTATGGGIDSLSLSFSTYDTIEKLAAEINSHTGYRVTFPESTDPLHKSTDLLVHPPININDEVQHLRTRRWSDSELTGVLTDALRRHNLSVPRIVGLGYTGNYDFNTLPDQHHYFVVLLGQIEIMKMLVHDSNKRRGTDLTVTDYNTIKESLEKEYADALKAMIASVSSLSPVDLTVVDQGNVVSGTSYRERLRSPNHGTITPPALSGPPEPSILTAEVTDDDYVLLVWSRSPSLSFGRYELWRGITEDVSNRSRTVLPLGAVEFDGELVFSGASQFRTEYLDGFVEVLDPGVYYYRLYTYNRNGEYNAGPPIAVTIS